MFNIYLWGVIFTIIILDFLIILAVSKDHALVHTVMYASLGAYIAALFWPVAVPILIWKVFT